MKLHYYATLLKMKTLYAKETQGDLKKNKVTILQSETTEQTGNVEEELEKKNTKLKTATALFRLDGGQMAAKIGHLKKCIHFAASCIGG